MANKTTKSTSVTRKSKPVLLTEEGDVLISAPTPAAIESLARRYQAADGPGMQLLGLIGAQADGLLDRLPQPIVNGLEKATMAALNQAFDAAQYSRARGWLPQAGDRSHTLLATALGMAGGAGGVPTALAELPLTTTILLRAIQGISRDYGYDPEAAGTRLDCLQVFTAAGPLEDDDGADLGFLAARATLTGITLNTMIARVAPRLSVILGQKLAAQSVPILGAVAGAATNYIYVNYYQEMAHISFSIKRMADDSDVAHQDLITEFTDALDVLTDEKKAAAAARVRARNERAAQKNAK